MAGSNRTTLITGASRGIGRACADRLTAAGHHIVNLDLSAPDEAFKGDFYEVDLGDRRAVGACLERLSQQYEFNGLLNNVGTTGEQSLEEIELDVFDRVMEINVVTAIQCVKACIPSMKAQRFGRIVNVSSELILGIAKRTALRRDQGNAFECCTHLVAGAHAVRDHRQRHRAGAHQHRILHEQQPDRSPQREAKLKRIAAGRFGEPEDMANMVDFLMKEESEYVTGQTLFVCGGSSIGNAFLP